MHKPYKLIIPAKLPGLRPSPCFMLKDASNIVNFAIEHPQHTWKVLLFGRNDPGKLAKWYLLLFRNLASSGHHTWQLPLYSQLFLFSPGHLMDVVVEGYLCTFQMTLVHARPKDDTTWSPQMWIVSPLNSTLTPHTSSFLHNDHRINPLLCFSSVCVICWLQRKRRPPSSPCLDIWTQNTPLGKRLAHTTWQEQTSSISYSILAWLNVLRILHDFRQTMTVTA